jgi:hypothetical protein
VYGQVLRLVFAVLGVLLVGAPRIAGAADGVRIESREKWSAMFGESEVNFTFDVTSTDPFQGVIEWSLSADQRTIARGDSPVGIAPGMPASVRVPLKIPPVHDRGVFAVRLSLSVSAIAFGKPAATIVKPLWVFSRDPFVDRVEWLKKLKITLYDPGGHTAGAFDKANIPYKETRNIAALALLEEGLFVIGEGTSLADHGSLGDALVQVAARGIPVLCLAPAGGSLVLTAADDGRPASPSAIHLKRSLVIRELDKRLDADAWLAVTSIVAARVNIQSNGDQVAVEVSESDNAWPWLEVRYRSPSTSLLVCGFGIIRHWDAGPTPRYLLARLLELLTEKPDDFRTQRLGRNEP